MKYYIVKFSMDWADEFDACGISVATEEKKLAEESIAKEHKDVEVDTYFGTNEGWDNVTIGELARHYQYIEVSENTYFEMYSLLTTSYSSGFGTWFYWLSELLEQSREDDEDYE